jgi:hypothetical protein
MISLSEISSIVSLFLPYHLDLVQQNPRHEDQTYNRALPALSRKSHPPHSSSAPFNRPNLDLPDHVINPSCDIGISSREQYKTPAQAQAQATIARTTVSVCTILALMLITIPNTIIQDVNLQFPENPHAEALNTCHANPPIRLSTFHPDLNGSIQVSDLWRYAKRKAKG